ncbi:MAG: DUF342 domain-containing protein [Spirochaetaceae bacterium]|nr:MAG: DUF342 domain-containing protein [Spirochaetaceae bacterium]
MVKMSQLRSYMRQRLDEDKTRRFVHVSGDTLQDALREASIELSLPIKKIEYEVLEKGAKNVLGKTRKPFLVMAYPMGQGAETGDDSSFDSDFGFDSLEPETVRDGRVFVRLTPDGVMLKVTAPDRGGVRATERMAIERIVARTDTTVDTSMVAKVVKHADGEYVRVGRYDYNPAYDAVLSVEITDAEMKAWLTALPPGKGGSDPDRDTLVTFLESNGVVSGLNEDLLAQFVDEPMYKEPVLVAEGEKPENGRDARVVYNFETDSSTVHLKETDGKVDFKELNLVQNVVEGQVLAKKSPPERGKPGRTVTGKLLPARDGGQTTIQIGKNVRLSDDGSAAYAEINGQVTLLAGKINVEPVYVINGNVNLKTGNVLFLGTVLVKGNVDDGFSVKAAGNIEIMGNVGKSALDAEGDIIVHQGIAGKNSGTVRCGKNLWSRFIENASVQAGGVVAVSDGIMNSEVDANKKVVCRGKRASIVGGHIRASEEIDAKALGSTAGVETILEVGYDPERKKRFDDLSVRKEELLKSQEEIDRNLGTLENLKRNKGNLTKEKLEHLIAEQKHKQEILREIKKIDSEMQEIQEYLSQLKTHGRISASGTVFPGVKIHIKDAALEVRNEFKAVTFISEANTVRVTKYVETETDVEVTRRS